MAGNTRGKIKEHLEGCHRNLDWLDVHLQKTSILIQEHNPKLTAAVETASEFGKEFDKIIMNIYSQI